MAAANNKELLQVLAYSYFAENQMPKDVDGRELHFANWLSLFRSQSALKTPLGKNLSSQFPYASVLNDYKLETDKKGGVVVHPHVKITYGVAKKLHDSKLLGDMTGYYFLDQGDPFTQLIKDKALNKIIKVFKIQSKADILSAVDLFAVKKNRVEAVQSEFEEHIINASESDILNNFSYGKTGRNTYRTITNKFFLTKDLVGISLKMPVSVAQEPHLSVVGTVAGLFPEQQQYIDPYTKFIHMLMGNERDLRSAISKIVKFVSFDYRDHVNAWKSEVEFDYKALNLHDYNVNFNLLAWAGVGYNGQFKRGPNTAEQFVGGASFTAAETLLRRYPEYNTIVKELKSKRKAAFAYAIAKDVPSGTLSKSEFSKIKNEFERAKQQLEYDGVVSGIRQNQYIKEFSEKYDRLVGRSEATWDLYRAGVIRLCKNEPISQKWPYGEAPLEKNYHNSQGFWFLNRGGEEYLKQRIFLTLFGLITKKGFNIYDSSLSEVRSALQKEFTDAGKKLTASIQVSPHILMS